MIEKGVSCVPTYFNILFFGDSKKARICNPFESGVGKNFASWLTRKLHKGQDAYLKNDSRSFFLYNPSKISYYHRCLQQ